MKTQSQASLPANRTGSLTRTLHRVSSPMAFYRMAGRLVPWCRWICLALLVAGLFGGLVLAPPDYQQGDSFRIIYIHVPSAWMSMFIYMMLAGNGAVVLIWRVKLAEAIARASAPLGASFTFLALATGSLWGKPMWGTWWIWDARLTSELILLFLYLGYIALVNAIPDRRNAARAGAVLALVGVVNIPIIHYSVEWWNTLHQGPTVTKFANPSIAASMLIPLLIMALAFMFHYAWALLLRVRNEILEQEKRTAWVRQELLDE